MLISTLATADGVNIKESLDRVSNDLTEHLGSRGGALLTVHHLGR